MKAVIISRNFSPAFISHMIAYYKLLSANGYDTYYFLDKKYFSFDEFDKYKRKIICNEMDDKFDIALISNVSLNHIFIANRLKSSKTKVIYIFHEPDFGLFREKESLSGKLRLFIACCCSMIISHFSAMVLLPSKEAITLYDKKFKWCNSNSSYLPLLFDDEVGNCMVPGTEKKYFSFLGAAIPAHNFDVFLKFIKYSKKKNKDLKFCIATKTNIGKYIENDKLINEMIARDELVVRMGNPLPNEEMNYWYLRSYCIWNAYACSTQSGVLPRAYMTGTAVLATKVGSSMEFVEPGKTGEIVDVNDFADMLDKVVKVKEKRNEYLINCRNKFLSSFFYRAEKNRMMEIINKL